MQLLDGSRRPGGDVGIPGSGLHQQMWWPGASSPGASGDNVGAVQWHSSQWEVDAKTSGPLYPWRVEQEPAPAPKARPKARPASDASAASSIWRDQWTASDWTASIWRDQWSSWTASAWEPPAMPAAEFFAPPPMLSPAQFLAQAAPASDAVTEPPQGRKKRGGTRLNWFRGLWNARQRGSLSEKLYLEANPDPKRIKANP